jgi:hypothetical protein
MNPWNIHICHIFRTSGLKIVLCVKLFLCEVSVEIFMLLLESGPSVSEVACCPHVCCR